MASNDHPETNTPREDHNDEEDEEEVFGEEAGDDDPEAFIDLNDPENRIISELNDTAPQPPPTEDDMAAPAGEFPDDKEPEREDAIYAWCCPSAQPLHAVVAHPTQPHVVAVGGEDERVYVLDFGGASVAVGPAQVLSGHTDTVNHISFSPDGSLLATGSMDSTVRLWQAHGGAWTASHRLEDLAGEVEFLLWHPSSKVLLGGGADAQAIMWNVAKGTVAQYFVGHRGAVTAGAWACDVKKVLTASSDGSLIVFSPKTGELEANIRREATQANVAITCLAPLDAAAEIFAVGCEDGSMHVASVSRGRVVQVLPEVHDQAVESIAMCRGTSDLFASCSCDCRVVVWNADLSVRSITMCGEGVTRLLWIGNLLLAGCTDGDVRVWDGRNAAGPPQTVLMGHRRLVLGLTAASDARYVFTCADDGSVRAFTKERYSLDEPAIVVKAVMAHSAPRLGDENSSTTD